MVVRDGEGKDLLVDLILALNSTEELDDAPHRKGYAIGILSVRDVERSGAALHLASQEQEVHIVRGHEEGLVPSNEVANKWRQLGELVLSKRVSFEPNGVVRLSKQCYFLITPRIASTLTIEKTCPFPRRLRFRICIL